MMILSLERQCLHRISRAAAARCGKGRSRLLSSASAGASKKWDYDVLIVGGGVVGASLACRLAQGLSRTHGTKVGIIEGRPPPALESIKEDAIPDPRVYALTPTSVSLLKSVGAWDLLGKRHRPFQFMQVWEGGASGSIRFDAAASKSDRLGTMAENSMLQAALFDRLHQHEKDGLVDIFCPAQVQAMAFEDDTSPPGPAKVTLVDKDGNKRDMTTRLLIGADGANSRVKKTRGLPSWGWDYGQRALVATVKLEGALPDKATAWQTFLPEGPLALLPLWGNYASIVWSTTPAEADRLKKMDEEAFITELNTRLQTPVGLLNVPNLPPFVPQAVTKAVGGVHHLFESVVVSAALNQGFHLPPIVSNVCTPRLGFDLRAEHAHSYVGSRAVLVGDAAHTIHPMAGQGLNLGMYDVIALAELLETGVAGGQDLGSEAFLKAYQSSRQVANLSMLGALTALHKLYRPNDGPVRWLRNIGLGGLNALGPIKAKIAAQAMGLEESVIAAASATADAAAPSSCGTTKTGTPEGSVA